MADFGRIVLEPCKRRSRVISQGATAMFQARNDGSLEEYRRVDMEKNDQIQEVFCSCHHLCHHYHSGSSNKSRSILIIVII